MITEVTEDHSLFNNEQVKIKPSEITTDTKFEYYDNDDIFTQFNTLTKEDMTDSMDSWLWLLNSTIDIKREFIASVDRNKYHGDKVALAKLDFITKCVKYN
jgi:hypothetical protein